MGDKRKMTEESTLKEILHIHENYEKEGGKCIKPSFNFIVVCTNTDDFIVTKTLQQAKDKAIEYGKKMNEIFDIYEVVLYPDNTYRASIRFYFFPNENDLREDNSIKDCMHIAWRTRGALLEVVE